MLTRFAIVLLTVAGQSVQLNKMMEHFNTEFGNDDRRHEYFNYGCNCFMEGNWGRISGLGHGAPIDPLDATCYSYKNCLSVVRATYGSNCKTEDVDYRTAIEEGEMICADSSDTCRRSLCECDVEFAEHHNNKRMSFNVDYYTLSYRESGKCAWIPTEHCRQRMKGKLPKQPCHPAEHKENYVYHYDYTYQDALTHCSVKGQYLLPYKLWNSDAAEKLSELAKNLIPDTTSIKKLWLPYELPPETSKWYNFYTSDTSFIAESSALWNCGKLLNGKELQGAGVTGACLIFLQNTTASESDECGYGYYMTSCRSTEPETICSSSRTGETHQVAPIVTTKSPLSRTAPINTFEDCNNGWLYGGDASCVKLFTTPTTWHEAQSKCSNLSATLVTSSESKYANILEDYYLKVISPIWTGYQKEVNETGLVDTVESHATFSTKQFHILDGTRTDGWHSRIKDSGCVEMADYGHIVELPFAPGLSFAECEEKKAFICQRFDQSMAPVGQSIEINPKKTIIPSMMKAIANRNYEKIMTKPNCQFGWYLDGKGNCVRLYYELKTWQEAKVACETVNSHLAYVNDDSYDNLLRKGVEVDDGIWIGYNDLKTEGLWTKPTGDLATYTNFPETSRANTEDDESLQNHKIQKFADCEPECTDCAALFDYGFGKSNPGMPVPFAPAWGAAKCLDKKRYMCQKDAFGHEGSGEESGSGDDSGTITNTISGPIKVFCLITLLIRHHAS